MPPQESLSLREPLLGAADPSLRPSPPHDDDDDSAAREDTGDTSTDRPLPTRRSQRNVTLTLLYTLFAFAGSSIWGSNVLATYVFLIENRKAQAVGYFTGIMGLANLLCSLPAGYISDMYRRDAVLTCAGVIRAGAIATAIYALLRASYVHLLVALAIWGSSRGMANTAMGAIFADSIPDGKRSYYFTQRTMLRTTGSTAGPIVSLVMFVFLGDHWTARECSIVLIAGQIISMVAMFILCFFNDDDCVPHQDDSIEAEVLLDPRNCPPDDDDEEEARHLEEANSLLASNDAETDISAGPASQSRQSSSNSWFRRRRVALYIASSDVMQGLAAGMSIRYFPIFFMDNLGLGPVMVQVMYVLGPLAQAILMKVSQKLSKRFGRCFVSASFRWMGITLMFAMILSYRAGLPIWLVSLLYVLRTGFMNGTKALTRSLLMDSVPKEERGRWSALESVNTLSWSGSAVVGGFLVGALGLIPLFVTTACLQICSTLPLVVLFGKDDPLEGGPRNDSSSNHRNFDAAESTALGENGSNNDLHRRTE